MSGFSANFLKHFPVGNGTNVDYSQRFLSAEEKAVILFEYRTTRAKPIAQHLGITTRRIYEMAEKDRHRKNKAKLSSTSSGSTTLLVNSSKEARCNRYDVHRAATEPEANQIIIDEIQYIKKRRLCWKNFFANRFARNEDSNETPSNDYSEDD